MAENYDYIVVGSGIAGLYSALLASQHGSVLLLTKGKIDDCNTRYAQGGIAAAIGRDDSTELHFRDTIKAGAGLCDWRMVRILVDEAIDRITDLINFGVPFDTTQGEIALTREAAHSVSRIIHAGGDATGIHIEETLSRKLMDSDIELKQNCLVVKIFEKNECVEGLKALELETNQEKEYHCRFLVMATGGAGQLFTVTTNSEVATGDGVALAYRTGASIKDMELIQFHPTAIHLPGVAPFLISEAVRGEGGVLRNAAGHRFMPDYAAEGDLASRDVVSRSILEEMTREGRDEVYLDVTHLPASLTSTRFPQIYRFCLDKGLDITREMIPVAPAAHYMIGGIRVDSWGESSIKNLFAAGEVACTGVHGANRLASNSLLEVPVFAKRIIEKTISKDSQPKESGRLQEKDTYSLPKREVNNKAKGKPNLEALKRLMWHNVGIVRDRKRLEEAADTLAGWQNYLPEARDRASYELESLILTGRLVTEAALIREESRGVHYRSDFPESLSRWQKHIIFKIAKGG